MSSKLEFSERCYSLLKKVPKGYVTTYGEIARAMGTKAYRAVGQAMHHNPYLPEVPCHRVVKSDGTLGGYALGPQKKQSLLRSEGVPVKYGKVEDFNRFLYKFK